MGSNPITHPFFQNASSEFASKNFAAEQDFKKRISAWTQLAEIDKNLYKILSAEISKITWKLPRLRSSQPRFIII